MNVEREWCEKHGAVVPTDKWCEVPFDSDGGLSTWAENVCPYCGTLTTELPEQEK